MTDRLITWLLKTWVVLVLVFMFTPIAMLVLFAFNDNRFSSLPWSGTTLKWFAEMFSDPAVIDSFKNSIWVALVVALISATIGSMAAYLLTRWQFKGLGAYVGVTAAPPAIPVLVLALSFTIFFRELGIGSTLTAVVVAHTAIAAPFAMGVMRLRLAEMDPIAEQAAWNLGANYWKTIFLVVIPQAIPAFAAGFLLSAALSWDEMIVSWYVSGMDITIPVYIWGQFATSQISTKVNAIGTVAFVVSISIIVLGEALLFGFGRKKSDKSSQTQLGG